MTSKLGVPLTPTTFVKFAERHKRLQSQILFLICTCLNNIECPQHQKSHILIMVCVFFLFGLLASSLVFHMLFEKSLRRKGLDKFPPLQFIFREDDKRQKQPQSKHPELKVHSYAPEGGKSTLAHLSSCFTRFRKNAKTQPQARLPEPTARRNICEIRQTLSKSVKIRQNTALGRARFPRMRNPSTRQNPSQNTALRGARFPRMRNPSKCSTSAEAANLLQKDVTAS